MGVKRVISLTLVLLFLFGLTFSQSQEVVYVIRVFGVIDLGLSAFIKRSLQEAKENKAKTIILEIDTFGGRVDAALDICKYLEEIKPINTIAFIDDKAWSAGALISLACQTIIMSPGSSIGSAEPRAMGGGIKDEITDEKVVSAIRAKFKSLAEANNHPVNLALAMVDKDFEIKQAKIKNEIKILTTQQIEDLKPQYKEGQIQIIKTINPKGKLLNLTASEAKEFGLAQNILNNRKALFSYLGLNEKDAISSSVTWSEVLVRFLTHPLVSPLLLTLGFLGLLFELKIPGWGISGTLGLIFLALFFWGHYLAGLANWTEILIFILGVVLLAWEIFVLPGFGIAGASGIILILTGIFLALIKYPLHLPQLQLGRAFYTLGYAIIFTVVALIMGLRFLPKSSLLKEFILTSEERKEEGFRASLPLDEYLGKSGKTITILRPSGRAIFEGKILDVTSEGDFVDKDKMVKVINVREGRLVVEEVKSA